MKPVRDLESFRLGRAESTLHHGDMGDFGAFQRIAGRCPGCKARRTQLVVFHESDTGDRPVLFTRTIPHYRCDGKKVLRQQIPLETLQAHTPWGPSR